MSPELALILLAQSSMQFSQASLYDEGVAAPTNDVQTQQYQTQHQENHQLNTSFLACLKKMWWQGSMTERWGCHWGLWSEHWGWMGICEAQMHGGSEVGGILSIL